MKSKPNLNSLTSIELKEELFALRKQQFVLRMKRASGDLTQLHLFKSVRKTIARVKTLMTQKSGELND